MSLPACSRSSASSFFECSGVFKRKCSRKFGFKWKCNFRSVQNCWKAFNSNFEKLDTCFSLMSLSLTGDTSYYIWENTYPHCCLWGGKHLHNTQTQPGLPCDHQEMSYYVVSLVPSPPPPARGELGLGLGGTWGRGYYVPRPPPPPCPKRVRVRVGRDLGTRLLHPQPPPEES